MDLVIIAIAIVVFYGYYSYYLVEVERAVRGTYLKDKEIDSNGDVDDDKR